MNRSIVRLALFSILLLAFSAASHAEVAVGISVRIGPPALPVYAQPICPGPGYIWTPGYWAWNDDDGYYWVPGTWVLAPVGMLWTPGYWGWGGGFYVWHPGYWGPHVGFYGGINYGYGYTGVGFYGGEWRENRFYYNRSVTNVSVTNVTNVYNRTVIVNENHVSYNGGTGGVNMRPTPQQESYARERHTPELAMQRDHEQAAMRNRENFARENHGRPAIAATARPADFSRRAVVPARAAGGEYRAPAISPRQARVVSNFPANRGNANGGGRNDGYRPFTPPSRAGNGANDRGGNNNGRFNDRPAPNRMNENRPMPNRGNDRVGNDRPNANRPMPNRPDNRMNENRPMPSRGPDNRVNDNRPMPNRAPENRMNQPRPENPPREMSRPQPSGPRENSRPAPAPRQNAPQKAEHHGR